MSPVLFFARDAPNKYPLVIMLPCEALQIDIMDRQLNEDIQDRIADSNECGAGD
jgi:hypothetical protein